VESAVALTPEQQGGVSSNLQRIYGQGLNITFTQNPALIGGLRVRVGSDVYDGSVAARLQNIEENFA
jgi:F-type H+-transporting ATPase subunit delta